MDDPTAAPALAVDAGKQAFAPSRSDETPDSLIPKINQYGVSSPAYYQRLFALPPEKIGNLTDLAGPIDPFADISGLPAPQPTLGVLLTFEQNWRQLGTALGRLSHSVCLAPGEVTRVAMIDWQRKSTGSSSSDTSQADAVDSASSQDSAQRAVQNAVATDAATGTSMGVNLGAQFQAGASAGFLGSGVSASGSTNIGLGFTVSASTDSRNLSADAAKAINQHTLEQSHAVRSRRSAEVQEVSQSEAQTATTRVIANYNHMHALTMMYFEVLQVFQLQTRVSRSERCVFLPMKMLTFDAATLKAHREAIISILMEIGQGALATALSSKDLSNLAAMDAAIASAQSKIATLEARRKEIQGKVRTAEDELRLKASRGGRELEEIGMGISDASREIEYNRAAKNLQSRDLLDMLSKEQLLLNQHLWMRMEPSRIQSLLMNTKFKGEPLGLMMDPRPIGVLGSLVAFRWPFSDPITEADFRKTFEETDPQATHLAPGVNEPTVALPSGGFFGEAVLGQAVSAEKIDLTRFWKWQDSPIPILPPEMDKLSLASRAQEVRFAPAVDFGASLTQLKSIPIPSGSDLEAAINGLKGMSFEKMSNTDILGKMIGVAQEAAKTGAGSAATTALDAQKSVQDLFAKLAATAVDSQKSVQDTFVKLASTDAGKAVTNAAIATFAPEVAAPMTLLGGLANLKTDAAKAGAAETAKKAGEGAGEKAAK